MTVLRNITLAPREVLKTDRAEAEKNARALLERFGLLDKQNEYPDRLSGGQQQRVAIVRALAMRPHLMLLDEVTSALDPELVVDVLAVIKELAREGMTMLIATHEMGFARDIADRVCFLEAGRILEQGKPERIFTAPEHPRTRQFLGRIIEAGRLLSRGGFETRPYKQTAASGIRCQVSSVNTDRVRGAKSYNPPGLTNTKGVAAPKVCGGAKGAKWSEVVARGSSEMVPWPWLLHLD